MAAVTAPGRVSAQHQSLLQFVGNAPWSDERILVKIRELVLPTLERRSDRGVDHRRYTAFPKTGRHSVEVARQYCCQLGKQDNCQVAVTLSIANYFGQLASLPIAYRLYLPLEWTADPARRARARVAEAVRFASKPEFALDQIRAAQATGVAPGVVLIDAVYGSGNRLQTEIAALGLRYIARIQPNTIPWPSRVGPLPAKPRSDRGRQAAYFG